MAEAVFNKVQFGVQAVHGTPVPATIVFPVNAGTIIEVDRAYRSPEEDYGVLSRHQPGRASYGVRAAQVAISGDLSYQLAMYLLNSHLAGGVVPTGVGPYVWVYPADNTADTTKRLTVEVGTEISQDGWRITDALIDTLTLRYDALSVPGNAPWTFQATLLGKDREAVTLTAALTAPSTLETMEGHLTQLYEGTTATAFASLTELTTSLVSFEWVSNRNLSRRIYGSATGDTFTAYGYKHRDASATALVKIAATSKTDIYDVYNAAGGLVGERRWRVKANGISPNVFTLDFRPRITSIPLFDRDGEHVYEAHCDMVYDSTLASAITATLTNSVATL